jgi:hypothetical protein
MSTKESTCIKVALAEGQPGLSSCKRQKNESVESGMFGVYSDYGWFPALIEPQSGKADAASSLVVNSTIESMGVPNSSGTTTFTSDASLVKADPYKPKLYNPKLFKASEASYVQGITEFLQKPVIIQSGILSATDTVSSFPRIVLPFAACSGNPVFANKLDGYLGFRGDMVIRLEINGEKFQQGRYMLCYVPIGGASSVATSTTTSYLAHTNSFIQRTQLKRIEMDVCCDTEGEIRIPFDSCLGFWPISNIVNGPSTGDTAILQLFPYVAISSGGGSSTCGYTIWFNFDNLEMVGAAAPQSGRVSKGRSPQEKEQASKGIGPIESTFLKISKASGILASVPLLSAVAAPISWYSGLMGSAASVFGWSKPTNLDVVERVQRAVFPSYSHVDAPDNGQMIAASCKNMVDVLPGFASTDVDELDFSFFKTIPAYQTSFNWTAAMGTGTTVFQLNVNPLYNVQSRTSNGITIRDYKPHEFIAQYFNQWRGSMTYVIKMVKTGFHSGRLVFAFYPCEDSVADPNVSYLNSHYTYREIIDIRESNEFTVTVPFLSSSPWKNTGAESSSGNFRTGQILVYVLEPLVAPSNVTSSATLILEVAGGPDLEFAVPAVSIPQCPVYNVVPQSGGIQSAKSDDNDCSLLQTIVGSSSIVTDNHQSALSCVGERLSSFRTMLKMTNALPWWTASPTAAKFLNIYPFACNGTWSAATPVYPQVTPDLISVLSSIYLYSRGSVRYKIQTNLQNLTNPEFSAVSYMVALPAGATFTDVFSVGNTDIAVQTSYRARCLTPQVFHHIAQNQAAELSVPQYHRYHSRVNTEHLCMSNIPCIPTTRTALGTAFGITFFAGQNPGTTNIVPHRLAGDDFNFGGFISIPPMMNASVGSAEG